MPGKTVVAKSRGYCQCCLRGPHSKAMPAVALPHAQAHRSRRNSLPVGVKEIAEITKEVSTSATLLPPHKVQQLDVASSPSRHSRERVSWPRVARPGDDRPPGPGAAPYTGERCARLDEEVGFNDLKPASQRAATGCPTVLPDLKGKGEAPLPLTLESLENLDGENILSESTEEAERHAKWRSRRATRRAKALKADSEKQARAARAEARQAALKSSIGFGRRWDEGGLEVSYCSEAESDAQSNLSARTSLASVPSQGLGSSCESGKGFSQRQPETGAAPPKASFAGERQRRHWRSR